VPKVKLHSGWETDCDLAAMRAARAAWLYISERAFRKQGIQGIDLNGHSGSRSFDLAVNQVSEGSDEGVDRTLPDTPNPDTQPWRMLMFRKSTILSLAAAATFGVLAISTTSASAFHFGGAGARAGGVHVTAARVAGPHLSFNRSFQFRRIVRVFPPHRHWHWRWHFVHRPYWIAPVAAASVAAPYSVAPTGSCNCLTKQYTQEGAVVFKDLCTNEMAMNPPEAQSQAPVQQGYLQPQMQPAQ